MTQLEHSPIESALQYLRDNDVDVPLDLQLRARRVMAVKAGDMTTISAAYRDRITEALITYFEGGIVTGPRNHFRQATTDTFYDAFYLGWQDGGNDPPLDSEALEWLIARINQEYGFIDMLFQQVKDLRKDTEFDYFSWVTARADGYIQSAMAVYSAGKMFAQKRKMLTWRFGDTEHCPTCQKLNGQRHRAEWYIARGYFPGTPGANMKCGGYRCQCSLHDDNGARVTL